MVANRFYKNDFFSKTIVIRFLLYPWIYATNILYSRVAYIYISYPWTYATNILYPGVAKSLEFVVLLMIFNDDPSLTIVNIIVNKIIFSKTIVFSKAIL